ncbi:hypothetical protein Pcac1_g25708 [Phytophthora cactorum]|nr:hypothetical protein Pcac1_g25708 [Phytophthora cactorum]KAG3150003.1 hypothetical protein C6341_g16885 [Phytophthora cactorum]
MAGRQEQRLAVTHVAIAQVAGAKSTQDLAARPLQPTARRTVAETIRWQWNGPLWPTWPARATTCLPKHSMRHSPRLFCVFAGT